MLISHIAPKNHLQIMSVGDFDFALAHVALHDEDYVEYFSKLDNSSRMLFLDNGVWETGTPVDTEKMLELSERIQATHIYAPDYINDASATISEVTEFCITLDHYSPKHRPKIIAVAQGQTRDEWYTCLHKLADIDAVDVIAIPALIIDDLFEAESNYGLRLSKTRWEFCHIIDREIDTFKGKKFYATGTGAPRCVKELANAFPWIFGIDTTMACLLGSMEKFIEDDEDFKPREKLDFDIKFSDIQFRYVWRNIDLLEKWSQGEKKEKHHGVFEVGSLKYDFDYEG